MRSDRYEVRVDTAFAAVIRGCARSRAGGETWINDRHHRRVRISCMRAASCTASRPGTRSGWSAGFYGLSLGGAFFAESKFSRMTDASKVALVHLAARLKAGGYTVLDAQFPNPHLEQFGAVTVTDERFQHIACARRWSGAGISTVRQSALAIRGGNPGGGNPGEEPADPRPAGAPMAGGRPGRRAGIGRGRRHRLVGFAGDHPDIVDGMLQPVERGRGRKHPSRKHLLFLLARLAVLDLHKGGRLRWLFGWHRVAGAHRDGERAELHGDAHGRGNVDGPAGDLVEPAQDGHAVNAVLVGNGVGLGSR